ncbi:hypothetical protein Q75_13040 [Bacillus coahuilensis p1.1.43]|uniref:VOC domain-containing protein n=1 Tax=Bacillus coahuilensis p1.1.43 TaxID=1150625 RepID=A0A147K5X6_9BACI|nr:glyoxalase/bleomycin resistance/dioxygenase family protein [Bacillus coahuilensis]KUP05180.1 hypothetical protein Q75_13040 [Bacillus coahuilensis p1.1.43]
MKIIGFRYVTVGDQCDEMVDFFQNQLGLENTYENQEGYNGGIFKADHSWLEFWEAGENMPPMTMIQLIVENADEFASSLEGKGLELQGPFEQHGERMYSLKAPNGMPITFQSNIE